MEGSADGFFCWCLTTGAGPLWVGVMYRRTSLVRHFRDLWAVVDVFVRLKTGQRRLEKTPHLTLQHRPEEVTVAASFNMVVSQSLRE